jgi:hypothetical protein
MRPVIRRTIRIGEMIAAQFDEAARHSTDPVEVARAATLAVGHLLLHAQRILVTPPPMAGGYTVRALYPRS